MNAQNWKIGQKTNGGSLTARLSSDYSLHGVAEDMKCHVQCSVKANRDTKKAQQPEQTCQLFSDLEIIEVVETEWYDDTRDVVLYMNDGTHGTPRDDRCNPGK